MLKRYLPDILLTAAIIAGVFYVYGINTATVYGYKASDIPVHNLWVNEMDNNNIFAMVCILMAFIVLFIICMQHLEYKHIFCLEYFQLYRRCLSISCFCFRLGWFVECALVHILEQQHIWCWIFTITMPWHVIQVHFRRSMECYLFSGSVLAIRFFRNMHHSKWDQGPADCPDDLGSSGRSRRRIWRHARHIFPYLVMKRLHRTTLAGLKERRGIHFAVSWRVR